MIHKTKAYNCFFKLICGVWLLFIFITIIHNRNSLTEKICNSQYGDKILLCTCILVAIKLVLISFRMKSEKDYLLFLFVVSFFLSLIFALLDLYIPTNDFKAYYDAAYWFSYYGFGSPVPDALQAYKMPGMAGMTIINGLLMRLISKDLLGAQIVNCLFSSATCVSIYLLGKRISVNGAKAAGILYAIYPMRIVWCSVTTNQVGATAFMLFGILCWIKACESRKLAGAVLSGICFAISNMYHPSIILINASLLLYTILILISGLISRRSAGKDKALSAMEIFEQSKLKYTAVHLVTYLLIFKIFVAAVTSIGFWGVKTAGKGNSEEPYLVCGLNNVAIEGINSTDVETAPAEPSSVASQSFF